MQSVSCYFSAINEITYSHQRSQEQLTQGRTVSKNCTASIKGEKHLEVKTAGGQVFQINLQQNITRLFPISEGLVIEFYMKQDLRFKDLLDLNRNKAREPSGPDSARQQYSYVVLNKHPYNYLKFMGILRKHNLSSQPWFRQNEQIVYTSKKVPILISYNYELRRHGIYFVRLNREQNAANENNIHFENNFYLLDNLHDHPAAFDKSVVIVEQIFEELSQEQMLTKCKFIKGKQLGELQIIMLIPDAKIKIYSLNFNSQNFESAQFYVNPIKTVAVLDNVAAFFTFDLFFNRAHSYHKIYDLDKKLAKKQFKHNLLANEGHLYKINKQIEHHLKDSVLVVDREGRLHIHRGTQKIVKYGLKDYQFSLDHQCRLKDQYFQMDGSKRVQAIPLIKSQLFLTVLTVFGESLDSKFYLRLLSDVYRNNLDLDSFVLSDQKRNGSHKDEFMNFLYYCIYLLKLCSKNQTKEDDPQEEPPKKHRKQKRTADSSQQNTKGFKEIQKMFNSGFSGQHKAKVDQLLQQTDETMPQPSHVHHPDQQDSFLNRSLSNSKLIIPKFDLSLSMFFQNRIRMFRILHLLYQDMKIFSFNYKDDLRRLAYFQFCFGRFMEHESSEQYCDYYSREFPEVQEAYRKDINIQSLLQFFQAKQSITFNEIKQDDHLLEHKPPDLVNWVQVLLKSSLYSDQEKARVFQHYQMPVMFKQTKIICKAFRFLANLGPQPKVYVVQNNNRNLLNLPPVQLFRHTTQPAGVLVDYPLLSQDIFQEGDCPERHRQLLYQRVKEGLTSHLDFLFVYLVKNKITVELIRNYNLALRTMFTEILRYFKIAIPKFLYQPGISKIAYDLIGREDLYKNIKLQRRAKQEKKDEQNFREVMTQIIQGERASSQQESNYLSSTSALQQTNNAYIFKFISKALETSKPLDIRDKRLDNLSEENFEKESQQILQKAVVARLAAFVGQGAFNLGSVYTFITEVLKIPKINLQGVIQQQIKVNLDLKEDKADLTLWPEFHNGVATGLRLAKNIVAMNSNHLRAWILYQKPDIPQYDHGGFLLAMGLQGYLEPFQPTDVYWYLKTSHEPTSVGLLLGLAASRIGKYDENTCKTLCLHIPQLIPSSYDVEIPLMSQTAALVGLGLLYKGSSSHSMSEMALSQIGRKPCSDKHLERDGYSLAAGIALGLINLKKTGQDPSIVDLELETRLLRLIEGGKQSHTEVKREGCSSVREGNKVNTHVTGPAALLALAMLALQSNNHSLANKLTIPDSFQQLDSTNPNLILLKSLCRNLILWDSIEPSHEALYSQIPHNLRFIYENTLQAVHNKYAFNYNTEEADYDTVTQVYTNILAGGILAMGIKYAGTADQRAKSTILQEIKQLQNAKVVNAELINDPAYKNCLLQYNQHKLLSVHLLSLALVMSGTCDLHCIKLCKNAQKKVAGSSTGAYGFNMAVNMALGFLSLGLGAYTFSRSPMSVAALLISTYPHFPSSTNDNKYHLQALRHFYVLAAQQSVFHSVDIQTNQAINCQVEAQFRDIEQKCFKESLATPILMQQQSRRLVSLKVIDSLYYPLQINYNQDSHLCNIIYVKPKAVFQANKIYSYLDLFDTTTLSKEDLFFLFCQQDSTDSALLNEVHLHCNQFSEQLRLQKQEQTRPTLIQVFNYFQEQDTLELFEIYLSIFHHKNQDLQSLESLKILRHFYQNSYLKEKFQLQQRLYLNETKITQHLNTINTSLLTTLKQDHPGLLPKFLKENSFSAGNEDPSGLQALYRYVLLNSFPSRQEISQINSFYAQFIQMFAQQDVPNKEKLVSAFKEMQMIQTFPLLSQQSIDIILE